jgi:hypothetical protein
VDSARTVSLIYTDDVWFKDPFNEVQGLEQVSHIFTHMFEQVDAPRFVVTHSVLQDDQAFLTWDFLFRMRRFSDEEQCIRGATHVRFASDGRVAYHRDYWDAAEELYEKLPVVGSLMRWLKTRARN